MFPATRRPATRRPANLKSKTPNPKLKTLVFDVNETLLDLSVLDPHFEQLFGDAGVKKAWFGQMLQLALVATITDAYTDFATLGDAALEMVAKQNNVSLSGENKATIRYGMRTLPAHPEVPESLERLAQAGFRMVALTNSGQDAAEAKLKHAGLYDAFEQVLTVEAVRRFKPAAEVYRMAADRMGVETSGLRMVAAHEWDISGAMRAGCAGAFIARPGKVLGPLSEQPDIIGPDLADVATQLIANDP